MRDAKRGADSNVRNWRLQITYKEKPIIEDGEILDFCYIFRVMAFDFLSDIFLNRTHIYRNAFVRMCTYVCMCVCACVYMCVLTWHNLEFKVGCNVTRKWTGNKITHGPSVLSLFRDTSGLAPEGKQILDTRIVR